MWKDTDPHTHTEKEERGWKRVGETEIKRDRDKERDRYTDRER